MEKNGVLFYLSDSTPISIYIFPSCSLVRTMCRGLYRCFSLIGLLLCCISTRKVVIVFLCVVDTYMYSAICLSSYFSRVAEIYYVNCLPSCHQLVNAY